MADASEELPRHRERTVRQKLADGGETDLSGEVRGEVGAYKVPQNVRSLWRTLGLSFAPAARAELETLLPAGAQVLVSEM